METFTAYSSKDIEEVKKLSIYNEIYEPHTYVYELDT